MMEFRTKTCEHKPVRGKVGDSPFYPLIHGNHVKTGCYLKPSKSALRTFPLCSLQPTLSFRPHSIYQQNLPYVGQIVLVENKLLKSKRYHLNVIIFVLKEIVLPAFFIKKARYRGRLYSQYWG